MPKRGKKYQEARKLFDRQELYDADAALDLVVKAAPAKFDETVEVHIKLGVDGSRLEVPSYFLTELVKLRRF